MTNAAEFIASIRHLSIADREHAILAAPDLWIHWPLADVPVSAQGRYGTIRACSDVFAIGTVDDFVRVPLTPIAAQTIADRMGLCLITPKMSDAIWHAASVRLAPQEMTPADGYPYDASMMTVDRFLIHNGWIEASRNGRTGLVAGHKKDVVLAKRMAWQPGKVAIYGFHRSTGKAAQPLSLWHGETYTDYSHGARFVAPTMTLQGAEISIADVLRDPTLSWVLSNEGPLTVTRYPTMPESTPVRPAIPPAAPTPFTATPIRTLRQGMQGPDVARLQSDLTTLGYVLGRTDGDFGARTLAAVMAFQKAKRLTQDGLVGGNTRGEISAALAADVDANRDTEPAGQPAPTGEIPFVQARNYTQADRTIIDLLVVHDMEAPEQKGTAMAVANWFAGPNAPQASAHFCIDRDVVIRCVLDEDVAWHAPGANHNGIGLEHAGYARQSRADWKDDYSAKMLARSAALAANLCAKYSIPIRFVDAAGLLRGERGITTHAAVSKAFKRSTHVDPGANFPMDDYLEMIRNA